ncbi:divalent metal cation transporter [Auraticoccus sp. F435]|uniref:Divalent metal cation transporter n=1 Tax=Auraticoccus cholistanensis TaxID=2656650 RepID=A0A6A9UX59_9ACTN|nr:divalent metal cation transporter [Auraticoccus cholistanensis]
MRDRLLLLGPAFVAAIAYVDPGNVAANLSAGAQYGYLLVWVLVAANLMAVVVQYLSAKVGVVTQRSLPQLVAQSLDRRGRGGRVARLGYWLQAELVAVATDIAEVVGGAIALWLLFGVPLPLGGVLVGLVSLGLLSVRDRLGGGAFELLVSGVLAVIAVGFLSGLLFSPPDPAGVLAGLVPRFADAGSVLLATSMLGATVMPHAIYVHSSLSQQHHRGTADVGRALRGTRTDTVSALLVAGSVNIGMLLLAASTLSGVEGTDTIAGAHAAIEAALGGGVALLFAVGLLASGLGSTAVGSHAGAVVMEGLVHRRVPVLVRRLVTIVPAVVLLSLDVGPTQVLVVSQVVLSFGIPFALVPLVRLTQDRGLMGRWVNPLPLTVAAWVSVACISTLNVVLLWLTFTG